MLKRVALVASLLVAVAAVGGYLGYGQLRELRARATSAESHLRHAQSLIDTGNLAGIQSSQLAQARDNLLAAQDDFATIVARMDSYGPLYGLALLVPWVGDQAKATRQLAAVGYHMTVAGEHASLAADILLARVQEAGDQQNTERLLQALAAAQPEAEQARRALVLAETEYRQMPQGPLHPTLETARAELDRRMPQLCQAVTLAAEGLRFLPRLLGADGPRTYLLLAQDTGELRPTGGFIGNYGILTLDRGRIARLDFQDVYLLDFPYSVNKPWVPLPSMFLRALPEASFWALRDSNTSPDFPTSARQAAWFAVEEGAADRIDGVVAFTPEAVSYLLRGLGPITVTEFDETVTADNVEERIRYHQYAKMVEKEIQGKKYPTERKAFTALVAKALIEKLNTLQPQEVFALVSPLRETARRKTVLMYFEDPAMQHLVETYGLGGAMAAATGDYLWVVDMNLSANKANLYVVQSLSYTVQLAAQGRATAELVIDYTFEPTGELYPGTIQRPFYSDYLRVYVPPGSRITWAEGLDNDLEVRAELGKTLFATFLAIKPHTTRRVLLRYEIPLKLWPTDAGGWRYELAIQKQPGSDVQWLGAKVLAPPGMRFAASDGFTVENGALTYNGPLLNDLYLGATFQEEAGQ